MNKLILITLLAIIPTFLTDASAASICYDEVHFPSIIKLEETENGLNVTLGGAYAKRRQRNPPVIHWSTEQKWESFAYDNCRLCYGRFSEKLKRSIPDFPPIPIKDRDAAESVSIPFYQDGNLWFGIDFYRGEGFSGTGGIGRYSPSTRQLEIHRPSVLKRVPIQKAVYDGNNVWGATSYRFECIGSPPALGLIKYDWSKKELFQFKTVEEGPCGFVIHDLLWRDGSLWVATDIGLSRWIKENDQWSHYFPDVNNYGKVTKKRCSDVYVELLNEFTANNAFCGEIGTCRELLLNNLKKFRLNFYEGFSGISKVLNKN